MVDSRHESLAFFDGLTVEELAEVEARLDRRHFGAGDIVLSEGDNRHELYVLHSGAADVFLTDRQGVEHVVGRVHAGTTLGEMSLFTGQPAVGTVRAASELDVLVLTEDDFEWIAAAYPAIHRNVGAILSERLARTGRRSLSESIGRVAVLVDLEAPPILAYALACSVAWHTSRPTLLLVLDDDPPAELETLAGEPMKEGGVRVLLSRPEGMFAPGSLMSALDDLRRRHEHVLVRVPRAPSYPELAEFPTAHLAGPRPSDSGRGGSHPRYTICAWAAQAGVRTPDAFGVVSVPALAPAEESSLRRGQLTSSGDAGRPLGWVARDVAGLKVGLALGAGSLRGYAHVGVLRTLERAGLTLDYLAGTSIGAAVAGLYAIGYIPEAIADILDETGKALFRPTLPTRGLLSPGALREVLKSRGRETLIQDLPIPLAVVTADIDTREEVVFHRGLLWAAVLASASIPGVYPAQRIGGRTLVDGGVLNPVPSSVVAEMGADIVIAVRLGGGQAQATLDAEAVEPAGQAPSILAVITRSIEMMQNRMVVDTSGVPTISIAPEFDEQPMKRSKLRRFTEGRRYIESGEEAAEAALPRIASALPWLR